MALFIVALSRDFLLFDCEACLEAAHVALSALRPTSLDSVCDSFFAYDITESAVAHCSREQIDVVSCILRLISRLKEYQLELSVSCCLLNVLTCWVRSLAKHYSCWLPLVSVNNECSTRFDVSDSLERLRKLHSDSEISAERADIRTNCLCSKLELSFYKAAALCHTLCWVVVCRYVEFLRGTHDHVSDSKDALSADTDEINIIVCHY